MICSFLTIFVFVNENHTEWLMLDSFQAGLDTFGLRQFLRENPTKENVAVVFPSPTDIVITPELFMAAVISRGENFHFQTWEFFEKLVHELGSNSIGKTYLIPLLPLGSALAY